MEAFERLVLRLGDWDGTWWGLGWIRPAKHERISFGRLLVISFVLSVPGTAVALGLIFLAVRRLDPIFCLALFAGLMLLQACLNVPLVYFWNRRATALPIPAPCRP